MTTEKIQLSVAKQPLIEATKACEDFIRSVLAVAQRGGLETNWHALAKNAKERLQQMQEALGGTSGGDTCTPKTFRLRDHPCEAAWQTGHVKPQPSAPGVSADIFLCIPIHTHVPAILTYIHAEGRFTSGGDDTQRVRFWRPVAPLLPNAVLNERPNGAVSMTP